ncbi:MAG TPA: hypothetical protein VMJ10_14135, partial [Kofleriaceae bacterium]|nr:hypothetical protein [Kofleriaceae bacterium]
YGVCPNGTLNINSAFNSKIHPSPTWSFLGQQGANATGRANAVGKISFWFNAINCGTMNYISITSEINRYRVSPVPSLGSACSTQGTYWGTALQTFDSSAAGIYGQYVNNRLLPTYDFHQETVTGDVGYRDNITYINGVYSGSDNGCFQISWF